VRCGCESVVGGGSVCGRWESACVAHQRKNHLIFFLNNENSGWKWRWVRSVEIGESIGKEN
jgi:hypothetical protein